MHIRQLRLYARDLGAQTRFFGQILGLPIQHTTNQLHVQVGQTQLIFEHQPAWTGIYHYAFNIPENRFEDAWTWIQARTTLLSAPDEQRHYVFENWNADALYFPDADGNIAELIARHTLPNASDAPFSAQDLLQVSEIGWVVSDVLAAAAHLSKTYGLSPYLGASSAVFTAVGDENGLFILVPKNHPWLPTNAPAETGWFSGEIETPTGLHTFTVQAF